MKLIRLVISLIAVSFTVNVMAAPPSSFSKAKKKPSKSILITQPPFIVAVTLRGKIKRKGSLN